MRLSRQSSEQAGRPLRQRHESGQHALLRALWITIIVLAIVLVGAVTLLAIGPTDFGIVRTRVATLIGERLGPGYHVNIGRAVVEIDPVLGLTVRVDDIDVRDNAAELVARIPSTRFAVNPAGLLRLHVDINEIELSSPELSVVRSTDGGIYLGTPKTEHVDAVDPTNVVTTDGGVTDLFGAIYQLDTGIEPQLAAAVHAGFQRFGVIDGTLVLWTNGRARRFASTDFNATLSGGGNVSATLASSGYSGRWTANFERNGDADGHTMSAVFSQLTAADIFPTLGDDDSLLAADIPLYGRASIRFGADGQVQDASGRLDFGAGIIRFGEERETVLLDEASLRAHLDVATKSLILDPSTFYFGDTRGILTGRVTPEGDPAERRYTFDLQSPGAVLAPRDSGLPPVVAQHISASGSIDLGKNTLNFDNIAIVAGEAAVAATGSLEFNGESPSLAMAATFSPMSVNALKQIWVPLISPGARRWVMEHVKGGDVLSGRFEAAIPSGVLWTRKRPRLPDEALHFDMRFQNASFSTFGDLPPISGASGNIVVSGSTVGIDIDKGSVHVPSGTVNVDNGAFAVPNTSQRPAGGIIELQLSGDAQALGEIADADPIDALQRRKLKASDLSGTGTARVSVRLPLRDSLTEADVEWKVVVNTHDVASKAPVEGRTVSDANVEITVTPNDVAIYGKGKIDGVAADVSMSFPVNVSASNLGAPGDRRVRLLLDDAARKRFGVGLEDVLSGTVSALISDTADGKGQHYDLDLKRARVVLPGLGWTKGIGVGAELTFDMKPASDGWAVENLVLQGDGFGFTGSAMLDASYGLQSADIDRMALRAGDSIALRLTRSKNGYAITVRGASFDMRGMMLHVRDRNDQAGGFPDVAVDAQIDRLIGFNQEEIDNAALTLVSVGGYTQKITFNGKLGGNNSISLAYAVTPGGTTLNGSATDAGRLLRFTDLYRRVAGGTARIAGKGPRDGPVIGTMEVDSFDLLDEPAMQRIALSNNGGANEFNPRRVHFDRMVAQFRKTDRVLTIEDALLSGASVGATFNGRYDLSAATIDLTGTYLPAYAFNNLFSRIPVLGFALGGGLKEGLIGVTFKVAGPISGPEVYFNPLSAVAPGIFRKIFEFQRPTN